MQRNSVISLQPALGVRHMLRDLAGIDADAVYGCVDWYLYHDGSLGARSSRGEPAIEPVAAAGGEAMAAAAPGG